MTVLILDLEGTLFTSLGGQVFPRPGLKDFLSFAKDNFELIGFYTLLNQPTAKAILSHLNKRSLVPSSLLEPFNYIKGTGYNKDLTYVPNASLDEIILIDDSPSMIVTGQESCWIPIRSYEPPQNSSAFGAVEEEAEDRELDRIMTELQQRFSFDH